MKEIISDTKEFEQINIEQDKQLNFILKSEKKLIDLIIICPKLQILSPHIVTEFSVHDSFSFADKVSSFCPDHFRASLDVESLFTNIPLNEIIDICINLFCDTKTIHNLDHNDREELLTLATYELFFIFNQVMYRQSDGAAMGSPSGPILANAFL